MKGCKKYKGCKKCKRCRHCGEVFRIDKANVYVAEFGSGFAGVLKGTTWFDAVDCPACGSQKILGERYKKKEIANEDCDVLTD
jgi:hypothetical protein